MDVEIIQKLEKLGCVVVPKSRFVVIDKGEHGNSRVVEGVDDEGSPIECNCFTVVHSTIPCKIYHGSSIIPVVTQMRSKNANIIQGEIEDTDDIKTAVSAGRLNLHKKENKNEINLDSIDN